MRVEYHKKDKIIIREDQKTRDLYIIDHGQCEVVKNEEVIATLGKNEVFGELGWLENLPRSATVRASTDCTLKVIPAGEADKFITQNPSALMPLLRVVCHRLQNTLQIIKEIKIG